MSISIKTYEESFFALNNFSAHPIEIWDEKFPTCEHAYQWKKFADCNDAIANKVKNARTPIEAKEIANENKEYRRGDWDHVKLEIMREVLQAKYEQYDEVKEILESTEQELIIEDSPFDDYWGVGEDGQGQNQLGKLWMEIRDRVSSQ